MLKESGQSKKRLPSYQILVNQNTYFMEYLDRKKALGILKQLIDILGCYDSDFIALVSPSSGSIHSQGYQIHIKASIGASEKEGVEELLVKNGLALCESMDKLIIYVPWKK